MIPKIIHYCWLSLDNSPLPEEMQACVDTWKKVLPDYELKLWDLSTFDIESSQWVRDALYSKKYAFAADYIRCYALYNYGGIYLDCDVEVLKSFNSLLHLPYFIGREQSDYGIESAIIGFEKGNPLVKDLMDYYNDRRFILGGNKFDVRPIPSIILECINKKYQLKEISSIQDFDFSPEVISVFDVTYFSPKRWDTKELIVSSNSYTIHHYSGSWLKKRTLKDKISLLWYRFLGLYMKKYKI